jgi:hypothetical protein
VIATLPTGYFVHNQVFFCVWGLSWDSTVRVFLFVCIISRGLTIFMYACCYWYIGKLVMFVCACCYWYIGKLVMFVCACCYWYIGKLVMFVCSILQTQVSIVFIFVRVII